MNPLDDAHRSIILSLIVITVIAACALLEGVLSSAGAQEMLCKERSVVLAQLSAGYQEVPQAVGLAANGELIELIAHPDGKTWTLLMSRTDGLSCIIATGESWQPVEQVTTNTDPSS